MFFFILLNIILFFFCLYFYFEQQKLKKRITELEKETKIIIERKILTNNKEDLISINNISVESPKKEEQKNKQLEETIPEIIMEENNKKYTAKPIEEEYKEPTINKETHEQNTVTINEYFNPNEFVKKYSQINIPKENNNEYLQEISKQLKEQLTPQTIDLTDYEKAQEEQAIISYQELLTQKEKNKNQEKADYNYLEDLKEFRKLLD